LAGFRARFEQELAVQQGNLTEAGEAEGTQALVEAWARYGERYAEFQSTREPAVLRALYFTELQPAFERVKQSADHVLVLNQDAMLRKSDAKERPPRPNRLVRSRCGLSLGVWVRALPLAPAGRSCHARRAQVGEGDAGARVDGRRARAARGRVQHHGRGLKRYRESTPASCWRRTARRSPDRQLADPACSSWRWRAPLTRTSAERAASALGVSRPWTRSAPC
jgi:hypothetical protein